MSKSCPPHLVQSDRAKLTMMVQDNLQEAGSRCGPAFLLDGFNLAFRSFHAIPELTRSDGFPTNALHGWVKTLWRLADGVDTETAGKIVPAWSYVFFDLEGSHRHLDILPDYKANRTEMPEALVRQLPVIKELTRLMGFTLIESAGVEADDLIASAAASLVAKNQPVVMVSADKDFAQLIRPGVNQLLPAPTANPKLGWRWLDESAVRTKFGVRPNQIVDYLSLIGDSSDNIPGVSGVGPKTAAKWLNDFGTLEKLLQRWDWVKPERFRMVLKADADRLRMNQTLIRLQQDFDMADKLVPSQVDASGLIELLESMEMKNAAAEAGRRLG